MKMEHGVASLKEVESQLGQNIHISLTTIRILKITYKRLVLKVINMNKYYKFSDGWFTYYVNVETSEKKFSLGKDDILVESNLDDFGR